MLLQGRDMELEDKKIMVIDDDPSIHHLIKVVLEGEGVEILGPDSPRDAGGAGAGRKPDLIILDLMLPEVSGLEILEKLKEDEETRNIPVIILSVSNLKTDAERARALGADLYVHKPFRPEELVQAVHSALSAAGS